MSKTYKCEVAVVGGGPSGTTVAMELARSGVDVLLLERVRVPRHKCCAGGVTAAARELLAVDISAVVECEVNRLRVSSVGGRGVSWEDDEPLMFTVSRERLDAALWFAAVEAGARVLDCHRVVRVEDAGDRVMLECETCEVHALAVVGADGAAGIVGAHMGQGRPRHVAVGVALELERPASPAECSGEMAELVLGVAPGTHGWIFPMTDRLSVGIECHNTQVDRAAALQKMVAHAGLSETKVIRRCVHPIPSLVESGKLATERVLLVGDAAGLCDPLTGEGIRNAVASGTLAADVVLDSVRSGGVDLRGYETEMEKSILPELRAGLLLHRVVSRVEGAAMFILEHQEGARRACIQLLRGETSYCELLARVGGIRGLAGLTGEARK